MTANDFRRLALQLPGATENAHMGHPDFRVNGKIFATLNYPNEDWGMVKLPPERQDSLFEGST
ncbi:MAG TPA: MmcQ/YjbR family DNA-binding protein [Bryobacteraceae bacterium]|jgi:predicted DNA-binding protein (MmcQ/YjbR family)|nr:MmcQ/YjbR family DNA-binding protein [Bryobacteraceae bacterium]